MYTGKLFMRKMTLELNLDIIHVANLHRNKHLRQKRKEDILPGRVWIEIILLSLLR